MPNKLRNHNISPKGQVHRNLTPDALVKKALARKEAFIAKNGALVVYTGKYTGRSPKDKFIVDTDSVREKINWGNVNASISEEVFDKLYKKVSDHLSSLDELFIFDGFAGADPKHKLSVRVISEYAYQSLFSNHLLLRPASLTELENHTPQLTILAAPNCLADPKTDGTNSEAFIVLNLEKMIVLIAGTKYAGEIKKSIFSVLNFLLPQSGVFPMHCSANVDDKGNSALFFGLSGTGKTTLSADNTRMLVGDDEHGWSENGVFNFEGGCYAKCINLKEESEPQIWNVIKDGALLENVALDENGELDFEDASLTENTRVAYPIHYIPNTVSSGKANHPKNIIFLTADAFGVLPPVARLNEHSAMYHFLSGYTSKLAGTERGIIEPKVTFSECFGAPFMPLSPLVYADLLRHYITKHKSNVYLINTGWQSGPYGVGKRISIKDTREIVKAVLEGKINESVFTRFDIFNLEIPVELNGVNPEILDPSNLWQDKDEYYKKAKELVLAFIENFKRFKNMPEEIIKAGPKI